jgi:tRNA modification GTPase
MTQSNGGQFTNDLTSCCVIRATPKGRGAVATLIVRAKNAKQIVGSFLVFPQKHEFFQTHVPLFARFRLAEMFEEVVLRIHNDDWVELHCHGGDTVLTALKTTLETALNVSFEERQNVVKNMGDDLAASCFLPFSNQEKFNAVQCEALRLLPFAETELTSQILLAQYHGALSREIAGLIQILQEALQTDEKRCEPFFHDALQKIETLLASYEIGKHLTIPFRIVLVGQVNSGKSSLLNAILGFERAIVSPIFGTTRDLVSAKTVVNGWSVLFVDTAGIRETQDAVEQEGIKQTYETLADSDLILHVIDMSEKINEKTMEIHLVFPHSNVIRVFNKIDLVVPDENAFVDSCGNDVFVSAKTGWGLETLHQAIFKKILPSFYENTEQFFLPIVFSRRQYDALFSARQLLLSRTLDLLLQLLKNFCY